MMTATDMEQAKFSGSGGKRPKYSEAIPTPTAGDSKSSRNSTARRKTIPPTGIHAGNTLTDFVTMWPTPRASQSGPDFAKLDRSKTGISLQTAVAMQSTAGGRLNPEFVEWLMDVPIGWTASVPLGTRKFRQWLDSHGRR